MPVTRLASCSRSLLYHPQTLHGLRPLPPTPCHGCLPSQGIDQIPVIHWWLYTCIKFIMTFPKTTLHSLWPFRRPTSPVSLEETCSESWSNQLITSQLTSNVNTLLSGLSVFDQKKRKENCIHNTLSTPPATPFTRPTSWGGWGRSSSARAPWPRGGSSSPYIRRRRAAPRRRCPWCPPTWIREK